MLLSMELHYTRDARSHSSAIIMIKSHVQYQGTLMWFYTHWPFFWTHGTC